MQTSMVLMNQNLTAMILNFLKKEHLIIFYQVNLALPLQKNLQENLE